MTRQIKIAETSDFVLYSYGNGFAYSLIKIGEDDEGGVYLQGDDAETFRAEYEGLCEVVDRNAAFHELYFQYC